MGASSTPGPRAGVVLPARGAMATSVAIKEFAVEAERLGFDSLWVTDHVIFPSQLDERYPNSATGKPKWNHDEAWVEAFVALAFAAAFTHRIRIGMAVLVLPQRSAILVAKQAGSLDYLSGGRLDLGVGVGWLRAEYEMLGADFAGRGKAMDTAIDCLRACWTPGEVRFARDGYRIDGAIMEPKPVQGSRLPLLIGGHSDAALRRVVQRGDGWLASQLSPSEFRERRQAIERMADAASRDMGEIRMICRYPTGERVERSGIEGMADAGVTEILVDVHTKAADLASALEELHRVRTTLEGLVAFSLDEGVAS